VRGKRKLLVTVAFVRSLHTAMKRIFTKQKREFSGKQNHFTIPANLRSRPARPSDRITKRLRSTIKGEVSWCTRKKSPFGAAGLALDRHTIPIPTQMMKSERKLIRNLIKLIIIGS
jgi:hypothetical protein